MIEGSRKRRSTSQPPLPSFRNDLAKDDDVKVLGAWRTLDDKVWLDMDGTRLNEKAALLPGQYQRLVNLVLDLRPWLETTRPAAPGPGSTLQPVGPVAPIPAVTPSPAKSDKKIGMPSGDTNKSAPVLESIIQQIDKALQARLATSSFRDRGIQLVEGKGGIPIVKDGINRYEGVDAIPDPEIKTLIRQAVADWEKGQR
jgi:hypothetical protein